MTEYSRKYPKALWVSGVELKVRKMHGEQRRGADAILCGEALMRSEDTEEFVRMIKKKQNKQTNTFAFIYGVIPIRNQSFASID